MRLTMRIWILIIILFLSLLMIHPKFETGIEIKSVEKNSDAAKAGISPGDIITSINGKSVTDIASYSAAVENLFIKGDNKTRIDVKTKNNEFIFLSSSLNFTVGQIPRTSIKTGLDLSGGARALIKAANVTLSQDELQDLVAVTNQRLNTFGLRDISVKSTSDLGGHNYMLVEVAGATPENLKSLISEQGKFEAKIGNKTVFTGGDKDITHVFKDAAQSAVYPAQSAGDGTYISRFNFAISLSPEAAQRHADITKNVVLDPTSGGQYLIDNLTLILDGEVVDELRISADLKGQVATQIAIQGSGRGSTADAAVADARASMNKLQTVLITGSLPYKLEIVKIDTISPSLGQEFTKSLLILGLAVFVVVSLCIFARYRKINLSLAVMLTMFAEAFITIGIAALIRWNLDAPGIAGIIAGIGTGVGDQILLLDASSKEEETVSLRERIKVAFFIIVGSFATNVASMLPLFWTGAGMLKGFALTTIIGVSVGILVTRPAFADIIERIGAK